MAVGSSFLGGSAMGSSGEEGRDLETDARAQSNAKTKDERRKLCFQAPGESFARARIETKSLVASGVDWL